MLVSARWRRFFSALSIVTSWRRRSSTAVNCWVASSGSGRGSVGDRRQDPGSEAVRLGPSPWQHHAPGADSPQPPASLPPPGARRPVVRTLLWLPARSPAAPGRAMARREQGWPLPQESHWWRPARLSGTVHRDAPHHPTRLYPNNTGLGQRLGGNGLRQSMQSLRFPTRAHLRPRQTIRPCVLRARPQSPGDAGPGTCPDSSRPSATTCASIPSLAPSRPRRNRSLAPTPGARQHPS